MARGDGFKDFSYLLKLYGEKMTDPKVRKEALEAMAEPIVEEAKRLAGRGGGVMDNPYGNLADSIVAEIPHDLMKKNHINIGWTESGWYGVKLEKGYMHYAKHKPREFIKRPHLRPAYNSKRSASADAAINVLLTALNSIEAD